MSEPGNPTHLNFGEWLFITLPEIERGSWRTADWELAIIAHLASGLGVGVGGGGGGGRTHASRASL